MGDAVSYGHTDSAWGVPGLSPAERLTLLALAHHANGETGRCNPSVVRLAGVTGLSSASVKRSVSRLADRGVIEIKRPPGGGNSYGFPGFATYRATATEAQHDVDAPEPTPKAVPPAAAPPAAEAATRPSIPAKGTPRFRPPEQAEAMAYATSVNASPESAAAFFDHFTSNGWKVGGKSPMRDWRAAFRNWIRNERRFAGSGQGARNRPPQENGLSGNTPTELKPGVELHWLRQRRELAEERLEWQRQKAR